MNFSFGIAPEFKKGARAYAGTILHVDLTNQEFWVDRPEESFYRALVGGRGFILHYLLSQTPKGIDALSPENMLIFAPGLLTGTILPGTGRHAVGAKSPLTGALASSEAGGWFGHELKRAGLDALIVHGKSEHPVYLWVKLAKLKSALLTIYGESSPPIPRPRFRPNSRMTKFASPRLAQPGKTRCAMRP